MCEWGTHTEVENLRTGGLLGFPLEYRTWKIDACIAPIVKALNEGGVETIQSCCGHGRGTGRIDLTDGRVLVIDPPGFEHLPRSLIEDADPPATPAHAAREGDE